jgi:hypothetical protein
MLMMKRSLPEWFYPGPVGGWTADDLDDLPPEAPRRIELIDGALIIMSPQNTFHMLMINSLLARIQPPQGLYVAREMDLTISTRQRPARSSGKAERRSPTPTNWTRLPERMSRPACTAGASRPTSASRWTSTSLSAPRLRPGSDRARRRQDGDGSRPGPYAQASC